MGGMTGLLLLLWAGVTVGSVVDLQKRIIGGRDCTDNERLYHVILISENRTQTSLCGGSLIGDQWVLTAAHCWEDEPGWTMTAYLGRSPAAIPMEIIDHKIYYDVGHKKHDIMLLKLKSTTKITPVKLPNCKAPPNIGAVVEIAGHPATIMGPNNERLNGSSLILQCANTKVVDCSGLRQCLTHNYPGFLNSRKHEHWFCGQRAGVDASPGDSGGGVVFKDMIYGVISFTGNPYHACVEAVGFMNVCHKDYQKWIKDIVKPKESCVGCVDCFGCFG